MYLFYFKSFDLKSVSHMQPEFVYSHLQNILWTQHVNVCVEEMFYKP